MPISLSQFYNRDSMKLNDQRWFPKRNGNWSSLETLHRCVGPPRPTEGPWVPQQGSSPLPQVDSSIGDGRSRLLEVRGADGEGPGCFKLPPQRKVNQAIDQAVSQANPGLSTGFSASSARTQVPKRTICMTAAVPSPKERKPFSRRSRWQR